MKNKLIVFSVLLTFIAASFISCKDDDEVTEPGDSTESLLNLPAELFDYAGIQLPAHYTTNGFPAQFQFQPAIEYDNTPSDNPITNAGATLGRVLFYDKKLSANGTIACASCHQAEHGFSDPEVFSKGFDGGLTGRHSMGIVNARFYAGGQFFWDERAATLEDQVLMPFQDEVEMGLTLQELQDIINSQTYYPALFKDAFGDESVTTDRISKALAQFIRSMVSTSSKYDQARSEVQLATLDFPSFTALENQGKRIFFGRRELTNGVNGNCVGCHQTEAFVGPLPANTQLATFATSNGLDATSTDDVGVGATTGRSRDNGKFKVPSLVNIAVRPPYMHDGRFATLEEVIEHYSSGIQNHPNLISPLVNGDGEVGQFNFTQNEKDALVAFLKTLTDNQMLTDEKYNDPFE
ncbi:MAG: cytochrome-c peroxidase [Bacteroidia bacterium]